MINGIYNDVLTSHDLHLAVDHGWRSNRIVSGSDILIASLMMGMPDIEGILFLAIGEGDPAWDSSNPLASTSADNLHAELLRVPVNDQQIGFIDDANQPSTNPTNRLAINVDFVGSDIVTGNYQSLREFGLFGGDATNTLNSGYLINYVIHPRIDLTTNATLTRQLRLTFDNSLPPIPQSPELPPESAPLWLWESPPDIIDGVGSIYAERLALASVTTVGELCNVENTSLEIDIPPMKLVELKAKARLALETMANFQIVSGLQSTSVQTLMSTPVVQLAVQAGEPPSNVHHMMEQLSQLQVAMDNSFLQNKTLVDLVHDFGFEQ